MKNAKRTAAIEALLAAVFYAINIPASKRLLGYVSPTMLAGLLYLGAGVGVGLLSRMRKGGGGRGERLSKSDLPYVIGMIALDIVAPICLLLGLNRTTSANASLLNNFEIVATSLLAWAVFKETITKRLWLAIALVTLASGILSFESAESLRLSWGSLLALLAAACWGLENNCTRKISEKDVFEIVTLKGLCSGAGALLVGLLAGERLPAARYCLLAMLLGFVAYGLSIGFYIKAQSVIGAARTSTYYAVAPFIGALLSFVFLREPLTRQYFIALVIMLLGSALIVADTMITYHNHAHEHVVTHTHGGSTHTHIIAHSHAHAHTGSEGRHAHTHDSAELQKSK